MPQADPTDTRIAPAVVLPDVRWATNWARRPEPCPYGDQEERDDGYIVYCLHDGELDRNYVGLTIRSLAVRIRAHVTQARRERCVRNGGLMARIRELHQGGRRFEDVFSARILARADTPAMARGLESLWINLLDARHPAGFNRMPGGSSIGGPGNARPVSVSLKTALRQVYPSIGAAIADRNRQLRACGKGVLDSGMVYARLALGWSVGEALDIEDRLDERSRRAPFCWQGRTFESLAEVAALTSRPIASLRSRLHRAARHAAGTPIEIGFDRRQGGRLACQRLDLRWPATGEILTAAEFAARTGIPKSTIIHRAHRALAGRATNRPSDAELFQHLVSATDRRKPIALRLPSGEIWTGGERELVRRLLDDHRLECVRECRLSESGIRRRLRLLTKAERAGPERVAWAFGFREDTAIQPGIVEEAQARQVYVLDEHSVLLTQPVRAILGLRQVSRHPIELGEDNMRACRKRQSNSGGLGFCQ